jgi:GntR family transcriptional repressor for pyruvate dehydrogenase complex
MRLGLSRPALREGIRRLRSGGLLEARRGSGTYVAEIDLESVYEMRIRLEPLAAERAAQRRTKADLNALHDTLGAMQETFSQRDLYILADGEFHRLVARASRNWVLVRTLDALDELMDVSRSVQLSNDRHMAQMLDDVERLYAAIEREHPRRAANAMERHIALVRDTYLETARASDSRVAKSSLGQSVDLA